MKIQGTVWKFGDNVDTDLIIPARFLNSSDRDELARNCFADIRPGFMDMISPGDILVAGNNFGSGSSRGPTPGLRLQPSLPVCARTTAVHHRSQGAFLPGPGV